MSTDEKRAADLEIVKQHLEIIAKHTDNYTNGALTAITPENQLNVAELLVGMVSVETQEALTLLNSMGV